VNLVLFRPEEIGKPLPIDDARARHILTVLRNREGDSFDIGVVGGPRGKATVMRVEPDRLVCTFHLGVPPPDLYTLTLLLGLPRPRVARRILREATVLGVERIVFAPAARGERSYAHSRLWTTGEYVRHLEAGAQQAFSTLLPAVELPESLEAWLTALPPGAVRLALDNYEAEVRLAEAPLSSASCVLAVGPERGWSEEERALLRREGFRLAGLGERVLSVEVACVAGVTLLLARMGHM